MADVEREAPPVLVGGDGPYVIESDGTRLLDAMSGLFTTQIGYSHGAELGAAAAAQMEQLAYYPNWAATNPATLALTERILALAPPQMSRIFFTSGGSESVESAWKLARQHFQARGESSRRIVISRNGSYHGCSLGALSITGIPAAKAPFEPLDRPTRATSSTPIRGRTRAATRWPRPTRSRRRSSPRAPRTSAWSSSSRCRTPAELLVPPPGYAQRVREICDRHGVLLCCDEVICAFGRLGHWFGSERLGFTPDLITFAKGVTSGYAPLGGVIFSEAVAAPLLESEGLYAHGYTFGGHPVSCATALANIADHGARSTCSRNVREVEPYLESVLNEVAAASPIAVEARGCGFFRSLELVENAALVDRVRAATRGPRRDRAHGRARQPLPRDLPAADQRPLARRRARGGARGRPGRDRRVTAPFRHALDGLVPYEPGRPVEIVQRELGLAGPIVKLASNEGPWGPGAGGAGGDRERRARRQPLPRRRLLGAAQRAGRAPRRRLRAGRGGERRRRRAQLPGARDARAGRRGRVLLAVLSRLSDQRGQDGRREPCARRSRARATTSRRSPSAITERTKLVYVTNPNNPTGGMVARAALERFLDGLPGHVLPVLDEAYFEYVDDPEYPDGASEQLARGRRCVVLRTFSKIYGLAGFRVGYGLCPPDVAAACLKVKNAFDVTQVGARRRAREPRGR